MITSRDRLPLTAARVEPSDGYPILVLTIAGRETRLDTEWKPGPRALGWVNVGDDLVELTGRRTYRAADGTVTELEGYTDDPRVFSIFERFWNGRLRPGPVPIPE